MGIKLSYKDLNSATLGEALFTLSKEKDFATAEAAWNVARITRQFQKELAEARKIYSAWSDEYVVKDEAGKPVLATTPTDYYPFKIKEGKEEEFKAKVEAFFETALEIQSFPIATKDIATIKLSPQTLLALEPLMAISELQ